MSIVTLNDVAKRVFPTVDTNFKIKAIGKTASGSAYIFKCDQVLLAGVPYWWVKIYQQDEHTIHVKETAVNEV